MNPKTQPERPQLLIVMVSQDPMVLAKLVRTLRPLRVAVFCTSLAVQKGWGGKARQMLGALKEQRSDILSGFEVIEVTPGPGGGLPAYLQALEKVFNGLVGAVPGQIAFDCTTGQGLFHIPGYLHLRGLIQQRPGWHLTQVYCNADSQEVWEISPEDSPVTVTKTPNQFRFRLGQELMERFTLHGAMPRISDVQRVSVSPEELRLLYRELCQSASLRALFHSQWHLCNAWRFSQWRGADRPLASLSQLLDQQIARVTGRIAQAIGHPDAASVKHELQAFFNRINAHAKDEDWLQLYQYDATLRPVNRGLRLIRESQAKILLQSLKALAKGKTGVAKQEMPTEQTINKSLSKEFTKLEFALRRTLDDRLIRLGHHFAAQPTAEETQQFLQAALSAFTIDDCLKKMLLTHATRLPFIFESCITQAIADNAAQLSPQPKIYSSLELLENNQSFIEMDAVVLFDSGDLAVIEVKTHRESGEMKKLDANIKRLRDFCGAKSQYRVVFPLTTQEIGQLKQDDEDTRAAFLRLGMVDVEDWRPYLRSIGKASDLKLLGLDELQEVLISSF